MRTPENSARAFTSTLVKMSKWSYLAANSKPIEKQKVMLACVFSWRNLQCIKILFYPGMQNENVDRTAMIYVNIYWILENSKLGNTSWSC